jgi:hypothetical protein
MSETRTEKEIIAEAYSDEAAKNWRAPVQGYPNGIPWPLHLEAYQATPADHVVGGDLDQAGRDIRILLTQIDWLEELTGEKLEDDDAALVSQIRQSWAPATPEGGE